MRKLCNQEVRVIVTGRGHERLRVLRAGGLQYLCTRPITDVNGMTDPPDTFDGRFVVINDHDVLAAILESFGERSVSTIMNTPSQSCRSATLRIACGSRWVRQTIPSAATLASSAM